MELSRYLDILRRRIYVILLVTTVTVSVVVITSFLTRPIYQANTTVRVIQDVGVQDFNIIRDGYGEQLINTYRQIVRSRPILEKAISKLEMPVSVNDLREAIETEIVPGTELMSISVSAEDPYFAQNMANELAILLVETVKNLYKGDDSGSSQIEQRMKDLEAEIEQDRQTLANLNLNYSVSQSDLDTLESRINFKEDSYRNMLLLYHRTRLNEDLRASSVMIVTPASLPIYPANNYGLKEIGLGLVIGLFSGLALALILENMDTRLYSVKQLENLTELPVLGVVPKGLIALNRSDHNKGNHYNRLQEAYRLLGINLQKIREQIPLQTIMISSAVGQEGKSSVAVNLSLVLAERGQTVFLIEADMRRPSLGKKLASINGYNSTAEGLSDLLSDPGVLDEYKLSQALNLTDQPSLFFVEGGSAVTNPTALLASPRMDQLLNYFGTQGQTTVLDSPPVLGTADVSVIASRVQGVILVTSQGLSRREEVVAAIKQLQAARSTILGLIFIQQRNGQKEYQ